MKSKSLELNLETLHLTKRGFVTTLSNEDIAYIAGLFDGEGSIHFKRGPEKKKKHKGKGYRTSNSLRLSMEKTKTDESVLRWLLEVLGVGTLNKKLEKVYEKMAQNVMQYRWRCTFRDAYYVCKLLWPYAHKSYLKFNK